MLSMITLSVKNASSTDDLAAVYSSSVSNSFSSEYSFFHLSLSDSNALASPPQPLYKESCFCSSGVAVLYSASICFKTLIAVILLRYLVLAPVTDSLSSST